jgi:hypothetical protein
MKFETYREAEQFYFAHFAQTNNAHNEEDARLEMWLSQQEIEEN